MTTSFFGRPVAGHLVRGPGARRSPASPAGRCVSPGQTSRARGGPRGRVGLARLRGLVGGARTAEEHDGPVDARRFRMLIGIAGVPSARGGRVDRPHVQVGTRSSARSRRSRGVRSRRGSGNRRARLTLRAIREYRGQNRRRWASTSGSSAPSSGPAPCGWATASSRCSAGCQYVSVRRGADPRPRTRGRERTRPRRTSRR